MKIGIIYLFLSMLFACSKANLPSGSYEANFNSELWKDKASLEFNVDEVTLRQKMLGDLVANHLLGKSSEELIGILGGPAKKMDTDNEGSVLSYPTGPQRESYFTIDYEWLIIEFNGQGLSYKYSVRTD